MSGDPLESFAKNLRAARLEAGLTQEGLALAVGTDLSNVSRYENADREPGVRMVVRLASALNVSPGRLFDGH